MFIVLAALAVVYVIYFTSWFRPAIIHVSSTSRSVLSRFANRPGGDPGPVPVTFSLDRYYRLTEIKVVPLAAWQANPGTLPVWHLVADANPAAIKIFTYGGFLPGLKPAVAGSQAEPLQPDVTYRLFVTAGSARGQHDFVTKSAGK